jgi:hypothetical protein
VATFAAMAALVEKPGEFEGYENTTFSPSALAVIQPDWVASFYRIRLGF